MNYCDFGVVQWEESSSSAVPCILPVSLVENWKNEGNISAKKLYSIYDPDKSIERTGMFKFIGGASECEAFLEKSQSQSLTVDNDSLLMSDEDDGVDLESLLQQVNKQDRHKIRQKNPTTPVVAIGRKSLPPQISDTTPTSIPVPSTSMSVGSTRKSIPVSTPESITVVTPRLTSTPIEENNEINLNKSLPVGTSYVEVEDGPTPSTSQISKLDDDFVYFTYDKDNLEEAVAIPKASYEKVSSERRYLTRGKLLMYAMYGDQYPNLYKYAPGMLPKEGKLDGGIAAEEMTPVKFHALMAVQKQLLPEEDDNKISQATSLERSLTVLRSVRSNNRQRLSRRLIREQRQARMAGGLGRRIEFYDPTEEST